MLFEILHDDFGALATVIAEILRLQADGSGVPDIAVLITKPSIRNQMSSVCCLQDSCLDLALTGEEIQNGFGSPSRGKSTEFLNDSSHTETPSHFVLVEFLLDLFLEGISSKFLKERWFAMQSTQTKVSGYVTTSCSAVTESLEEHKGLSPQNTTRASPAVCAEYPRMPPRQ